VIGEGPEAQVVIAGMLLLEGFLVTTLDTAVRLMRYLLEELWKVLFGTAQEPRVGVDEMKEIAGACGIPTAVELEGGKDLRPLFPMPRVARLTSYYMVSSAVAAALMLWFAFSGGILTLWGMFAPANQLLTAFVLGVGAIWLLRHGRAAWTAALPAVFMLATTGASLYLLNRKFTPGAAKANWTLYIADWVLIALALYLVGIGLASALRRLRDAVSSEPQQSHV
jgi:carbon starvation protein